MCTFETNLRVLSAQSVRNASEARSLGMPHKLYEHLIVNVKVEVKLFRSFSKEERTPISWTVETSIVRGADTNLALKMMHPLYKKNEGGTDDLVLPMTIKTDSELSIRLQGT